MMGEARGLGWRAWFAFLTVSAATALAGPSAAAATGTVTVRDYDLGVEQLPMPGPKGPMPVRLWGSVAIPSKPGRRPLVVVAHGRHGDGCPSGPFDSETWPCFARTQRNDHGLRHLARAIAGRGSIAVVPDLNAAFTGGWGEPDDLRRWPILVNRTLAAAFGADSPPGAAGIPGLDPARIDPRRLGVLGHSRSGFDALRLARARAANRSPALLEAGRGPISALYLLAPVANRRTPPDVVTAVTLASCDGDTGPVGRRVFSAAKRDRRRTKPLYLTVLKGANHNYFNRTLAAARHDDSPRDRRDCRPARRLPAAAQQRWLGRAAADFFAVTFEGARRPAWMRLRGKPPRQAYGRAISSSRIPGR